MFGLFDLLLVSVIFGLIGWRLAGERDASAASRRRSRWRWVPLLAGVMIVLLTALTWGAGVVLAPVGAGATGLAFRRVAIPRGRAFWLGAGLNAWLTLMFLATLALIAHDAFVA